MTETVTLQIPEALYQRLSQFARKYGQGVKWKKS